MSALRLRRWYQRPGRLKCSYRPNRRRDVASTAVMEALSPGRVEAHGVIIGREERNHCRNITKCRARHLFHDSNGLLSGWSIACTNYIWAPQGPM